MNIQLLRNATLILTVNGKSILVDPMLAAKDSYDPIPNTANVLRNPLVDLPVSEAELKLLIQNLDAVLLTHIHNDHWDVVARQLLPKDITLFCQPVDAVAIRSSGFTNVVPISDELVWENIRFNRTAGKHGTGRIAELMGQVSGYVITYQDETLYLAGDTIWCSEVQEALQKYQPSLVVLNGGAARFNTGDPIVMTTSDILKVGTELPQATIIVVHLEAVNHSSESRAHIKASLSTQPSTARYVVPGDGDSFSCCKA